MQYWAVLQGIPARLAVVGAICYTDTETAHVRWKTHRFCDWIQGDMQKSEWADYLFQAHVEAPPASRRRGGGSRRGGGGGTFVWVILAIIAAIAAVAGLARWGPDNVKEALATAAEAAIGGVLYVYDSARGLLSRAHGGENPEALGFERLGDSNQPDLYAVP